MHKSLTYLLASSLVFVSKKNESMIDQSTSNHATLRERMKWLQWHTAHTVLSVYKPLLQFFSSR